jgi:predicted hydrolase (HD superfamily)
MKYLVIYKQEEDGCDHTIGCGTRTKVVDTDDIEKEIGIALFSEDGMEHSECTIASALYVPLESVRVADLARLRKHYADIRNAEKSSAAEAQEREQLRRLQAKYGGQ